MAKAPLEFVCAVRYEAPLPPPGLDARLVLRRGVDADTLSVVAATPIDLGPADVSAVPAVPYDVLASEIFDTVDLERFAPAEADEGPAAAVPAPPERRDSKTARPRAPSVPQPLSPVAEQPAMQAKARTVRDVIEASFAPGVPVHPVDATLEPVRVIPISLGAAPVTLAAFDGAIPAQSVLVAGCALYGADESAPAAELPLVREYDAQPAAGTRHCVLWVPRGDGAAVLEAVEAHVALRRRRATGAHPRVLSLY